MEKGGKSEGEKDMDADRKLASKEPLSFHRVLSAWFAEAFGQPTDVQKQAWPLVAEGRHVLISAPTGSGKTLAALLPGMDRVIRAKLADHAALAGKGVRILYVTPLKALNNDIRRHLFDFREEWARTAETLGEAWPELTVGVRTGDTTQSTRASMVRKPPDVLVTTPESLYMLLTSRKARDMLRTVETVIVDEIHDLAAGDRGMHFSLSLERLSALCGRNPQRIGVSATQNPVERIAQFLGGREADGSLREVAVVESRMERELSVRVTVPAYGRLRLNRREDVWTPLVEEILRHIGDKGTTLIFTGNRRLCERLSARLNETVGDGFCRSHHGSVSRERRLETEQLLREGKLRCLVATSSLELGIDVGDIDHVLQIDTPYTAASGIQRFGRSGHSVGGVSRGTIIVRTRGLLPEVAVLADRIRRKETEPIEPPRHSLAVLAQQIVAMVAVEDWHVDDLYRLIGQSDAYHGFPRERFEETLDMLAGLYPFVRPLLDWDRSTGRLSGRPKAAMAAITGSGTIPSSSSYPVYHAESRLHLGELDEEFVFESRVGDTFQLGASNWRIRAIRPDRIEVTESSAALGEIPFWRAEGQGRTVELGVAIGEMMERLEQMLAGEDGETRATDWLIRNHHFTAEAAGSLIGLVKAQQAFSAWPTHRRIPVEWYTDDSGLTHVVIHSWFGRRFNRTWLLAIQHLLEREYPHEFQSTAKDNGIELLFRVWDPALLDRILNGVRSDTVESLVAEALPASPLFAARFRQLAETALLLTRSFRRTPSWLKRLRGQELLRDAMPVAATFPLVKETMRECMERSLDVAHVRKVLAQIEDGVIERPVTKGERPSPLSAQFFFDFLNIAIYESDALTRDLRQGMLGISRELAEEVFGRLDRDEERSDGHDSDYREALAEESRKLVERLRRAPESADDLWQRLKERGDVDEREWQAMIGGDPAVQEWADALRGSGRISTVDVAGDRRVIPADERHIYAEFPESAESRAFVLNRFLETRPSIAVRDLTERYGLSESEALAQIGRWTEEGRIVPVPNELRDRLEDRDASTIRPTAPSTATSASGLWMSARLHERVQRNLAVRNRANRAEPGQLIRLLQNRHHLEPGRKRSGPEGVLQALEQLQGVFLPVSWWETVILPARVADYRPEYLDLLCASGELFWLGRRDEEAKEGKIAFFRPDRPDLFAPFLPKEDVRPFDPDLHERLQKRGACFLTALAAETDSAPSELTERLMEMVWQGLVANDQFAPLRLHAAKRTAQTKGKFRSGLGRWYAVSDLGEVAKNSPPEQSVLAWSRHLLDMCGIVTRAAVQAFSPWDWETHRVALSRLEELGLVVRGLFVEDIPALQFADRETVERLREPKPDKDPLLPLDDAVLLSAADPANPFGVLLDWPAESGKPVRFARKPGNFLLLKGGRWLLWAENNSRRISAIDPAAKDPSLQAACVRLAAGNLIRGHGRRKVVIEQVNGKPAAESPLEAELVRAGAERSGGAIVIWPSHLPQ